jgi:hypothetical protein
MSGQTFSSDDFEPGFPGDSVSLRLPVALFQKAAASTRYRRSPPAHTLRIKREVAFPAVSRTGSPDANDCKRNAIHYYRVIAYAWAGV